MSDFRADKAEQDNSKPAEDVAQKLLQDVEAFTRTGAESMALHDASAGWKPANNFGELASESGKQDNRSLLDRAVHNSLTSALSARMSYLGLSGQLGSASMASCQGALAKLDTPVASQLLARIGEMRAEGWIMRPAFSPNPLIGGGNAPFLRTLEYMPISTTFSHRNALEDAVITVSHEVAHKDGILHSKMLLTDHPRYLPDLKLIAERDLIKETRAVITEMHIADSMGVRDMWPASARNDIGRFVRNHWMGDCPALAYLSESEASTIAGNYLDKTFGPDLIDPLSKKVRAFDINAGVDVQIGKFNTDKQALELMSGEHYLEHRTFANPHTAAGEKILSFAETRSGRVLINSGKTLAALGALMIASDLHHAFQESPSAGLARTAKVGTGWMAFEGGAALAMKYTQGMGLAGRVGAGLLAGFGAAYLSDKIVGDPLERTIKSSLNLNWSKKH